VANAVRGIVVSLDRLLKELDLIRDWTIESRHGLSLSLKDFVLSDLPPPEFQTKFREYYNIQKEVIDNIHSALKSELKDEYKDIIVLVTGSVARLEYIKGPSDIDSFGITVDETHIVPKSEKGGDILDAKVVELNRNLDRFRRLRNKLKESGISISGVPYYNGEYFGTKVELFEKLGEFDEPNWAVAYRSNVIFESAAFCKYFDTGEKFDEIVKEINRVYCVIADLRQHHFPFLAAMLLGFMRTSGVLAKVSKFKSDGASKEALEDRTLEEGIIKTLGGRVWSSAVHLIMLHVLYWYGLLKPDHYPEMTSEKIGQLIRRSPLFKLIIEIPDKFNAVYSNVTKNSRWADKLHIDESTKTHIAQILEDLYTIINPQKQLRRSTQSRQPYPTIASVYIPFLLMAMHARVNPPKFTDDDYARLSGDSDVIDRCLLLCENLTLLLATKGPFNRSDEMRYPALFGTIDVFDKEMYWRLCNPKQRGGKTSAASSQ
jgi:hypothetical protein